VETVVRLLDLGCDPFNFADAMLGVLATRLCKRICLVCKESYPPSREEYEALVEGYGAADWQSLTAEVNDLQLFRGRGCEHCHRTGFKGRVPLHELLVGTEEIKQLIQSRARPTDMLAKAVQQGMLTLIRDGIRKVLRGLTTYRQVRAVASK
jgi:type II secretory ATPase GspE/PulE/Tfp pilus assembly ATPase PilB-like protein